RYPAGGPLRSVLPVAVGDRGECGLRFPRHVGVSLAQRAFEDLDDAVRRPIQVVAGVTVRAVRQLRALEGEYERAVDALGVEDVEQLSQVRRLLRFVTRVVA